MSFTKITNAGFGLTTGTLVGVAASFSSTVSVGGTLTYEDVTNVDSVGLITARNGIEVTDKGVQVGTGATVDSAAANTLTFLTGGSERVRVDSSGKVGIGTDNPNRKLVISQANSTAYSGTDFDQDYHVLKLNNTTDSKTVGMQFLIGSNGEAAITATETSDGATDLAFGTRGSGSRAERLRITDGGTILAGGQSSSYDGAFVNLELRKDSNTVGGSMTLVNDTASQAGATCEIDCYQNYRGAGKIVFGRENANNWQSSAAGAASFLAFHTNTAGTVAERLRITSGGLVGIQVTPTQQRLTIDVFNTGTTQASFDGINICNTSSTTNNGSAIVFGQTVAGNSNARIGVINSDRSGSSEDQDIFFGTLGGGSYGERLRITSTGNIGINRTDPDQKLNVNGCAEFNAYDSTSGSGGYYTSKGLIIGNLYDAGKSYSGSDDRTACIWQERGLDLDFATNDALRMKIAYGGNIGIGCADPGAMLQVSDSTDDGTFTVGGNNGGATGFNITYENGGTTYTILKQNYAATNAGAYTSIHTGYFTVNTGTSFTERLRVDSSGKLLIGVTSDFIRGNLQVIDGGGGELNIGRNDTSVSQDNDIGHIFFTGNAGSSGHVVAEISCYADNNHTASSKSSRLEFYTTADGVVSQTKRLVLDSNGKLMQYASAGTDGFDLSNSRSAGTSTANFVGRFGASGVLTGTVSMACYTNGNIVNTNGSYTQISDISLKENIVDAPSQWDDIKAVKFRKFNFKESTGYETFTQIGVVAQELELTSPGLVYDAGTPGEPGNAKKAVKSSILTMKALVALQEAMARIETLEAQNADLLSRVTALEG